MKVRYSSIGGSVFREAEALRKFELSQFKKQIEIMATFIPDFLIKIPESKLETLHHFVGVFLFADISGFTVLCEKYNKTGKGGIYRLTATLNAFVGAIVEVVYFYGGDVMKFSGDALLAAWKVEVDDCIYKVIHKVIVCALFIQENLGRFQTEFDVLFKVKFIISCGNMDFCVIGDKDNKYYVVLGDAINEVKRVQYMIVSGDVLVGKTAWGHLSQESYDFSVSEEGCVKVWRCLYQGNEIQRKEYYDQKQMMAKELCDKHIKHRSILHEQRKIDNSLLDSKITENFVRSLPHRDVLKVAAQKWLAADMKKFLIKPVQEHIEGKQPLEYLTELREVTIQFINIVALDLPASKLVCVVNTAYQIVCKIVNNLLGVVNKVILFDKDVMILVVFGLRGIKHEVESQHALTSAFQILRESSTIESVRSVSIGVTNGLVYCGVVGHPMRKEYTVIGAAVNKAARLMCVFENKVTCDYWTFKNSKLPSYCFHMQSTVKLKGIEDAGHIFEYNETFNKPTSFEALMLPLIGREEELDLIRNVIQKERGVEEYSGICFCGKQKTGKSKILETAAIQSKDEGHTVATIVLTIGSIRPYFVVSLLYKQIYDERCNSDRDKVTLKPDLWDFKEILQTSTSAGEPPKTKISTLVEAVCSGKHNKATIMYIDNVQLIDRQSLEVISAVLSQTDLKLICAGHFEESTWDVQWKLSRTQLIKILDLNPLENDYIPPLCCQFLKTRGISRKLITLLHRTCEGRPGWIQSCLLRLINNGRIEVKFITLDEDKVDLYVFPDPKLLHPKHFDLYSEMTTGLISVAHLDANFSENANELTLAAISLDLFDSFPPYEQLVIKIAAVLGELFPRSLLFVMLKYPHEQIFAKAIKNLFEEEVLDCGSRYVSIGTFLSKTLYCYCYTDERDKIIRSQNIDLPNYAFCKLLHFKNKNLRSVAYDLLPVTQRKELHEHITDVLENQNNSCPNCIRDDSTSIIRLRSFSQMAAYTDKSSAFSQYEKHDFYNTAQSENIKEIIRRGIRKNLKSPSLLNNALPNKPLFKRKLWDPSTCFCLEILTRVYADLIYHSEQAEHLEKRIFYLMEYCVILLTLHEFKDSIPVLTEASELCMTDSVNADVPISEKCRKVYLGKIHMLLGESHLRLGHIQTAKIHVSICLRQYNIPMIALKYKIPLLFVNRPSILYKTSYPFVENRKSSALKKDFGICLTLLSTMFAREGKWNLAKRAAERSIAILKQSNANIQILCDAYSHAIELYNMFGDRHECERLERCIGQNILKHYANNVIIEMYGICKLISVLFRIRLMHGQLRNAIRVGYRALDLIIQIHAIHLQAEIIPLMASALLMTKRIENAIAIVKQLFKIAKTTNDTILMGYYGFCVELNLETSFVLEPIDKCAKYAELYFERHKNKESYTDNENKMIIFLHVHFLRKGMWHDALKWKALFKLDSGEFASFIKVSTIYKYVEGMLMTLVWNIMIKESFIDLERKRIEINLKHIQKLAEKWPLFMPRYLHYMAYYKKIMGQNKFVRMYLKRSLQKATKQGNVLEECWIRQNQTVWNGGVDLGNEVKDIDWVKAQTYSNDQWATILYSLPYEIII